LAFGPSSGTSIASLQSEFNGRLVMKLHRYGRHLSALSLLLAAGACSNAGTLGNVLGSVLGGGQQQANQVSGTVQGVDARQQVIGLQSSGGQSVTVAYDAQTKVVYQNQSYPVTSLDRGDQVTLRIQNTNNGYYTDLVQVDQPVQGSTATTGGNIQTLQGTVRQIDQQNGLFSMEDNRGSRITVSMPYSPSRADLNRFQSLRPGDVVRIAGVFVNNTRVELRQFY
jgi:tRNA(Ile2) C34 agmatinyltransferase TiaS